MGNWWFDRGVSPARRVRFDHWLNWAYEERTSSVLSNKKNWEINSFKDYWLVLNTGEEIAVKLPVLKSKVGEALYLGRGLSAEVVEEDGRVILLGAASWTESWSAPYHWVLVPQEDK
jgi:hypothetical protein